MTTISTIWHISHIIWIHVIHQILCVTAYFGVLADVCQLLRSVIVMIRDNKTQHVHMYMNVNICLLYVYVYMYMYISSPQKNTCMHRDTTTKIY